MYISSMKLTNFRIFKGECEFQFKKGINFFVGNNNCGKTTIFKALEFIQSGRKKEDFITKGIDTNNKDVSVEIEFQGDDIKQFITENEDLKEYQDYVIEDSNKNTYCLKLSRNSEVTEIEKNGKPKSLNIENIRIYNPKTKQYENPTGIDRKITALFDLLLIYSDLNNEDYQDFRKAKLLGKIINKLTKDFQTQEIWENFKTAHSKVFSEQGILSKVKDLEKRIEKILNEQYGDGKVNFDFDIPTLDSFFNMGSINVTEDGISTPISHKGTGMQRALALSLIQAYANINKSENKNEKPIFFCIDEPETFLHPNAQNKLMKAFNKLSDTSQIFLTTHSPYFLQFFKKDKHQVTIFKKKDGTIKTTEADDLGIFGNNYSPSVGEINYSAFGLPSIEFHNELYGFLEEKVRDENKIDKWLMDKKVETKTYIRQNKNSNQKKTEKISLPTYIRHQIHHPENRLNSPYDNDELNKSIKILIKYLKDFQKE